VCGSSRIRATDEIRVSRTTASMSSKRVTLIAR
jgi:hypothetical protein